MLELKIGQSTGPSDFENWVMIAKYISDTMVAFAWPIALVTLTILFKKEIVGLFGRITSADVAGAKMEFGDKIGSVQRQMPDIAEKVLDRVQPHDGSNPPTSEQPITIPPLEESELNIEQEIDKEEIDFETKKRNEIINELLKQVENVSEQPFDISGSSFDTPRERILTSWKRLEKALDLLFTTKIPGNISSGVTTRLWKLVERGIIPSQLVNSIHELHALRNEVAHNPNLAMGSAEAAEFARTATQMRQMLELLAAPATSPGSRRQ